MANDDESGPWLPERDLRGICISRSGLLLTWGEQGAGRFDLNEMRCLAPMRQPDATSDFACSPDGKWGFSAYEGGRLALWDLARGVVVRNDFPCKEVYSAGHAGTALLTVTEGALRVFDVEGKAHRDLRIPELREGGTLPTSSDGRFVLVDCDLTEDSGKRLVELATGETVLEIEGFTALLLPSGNAVLYATYENEIALKSAASAGDPPQLCGLRGTPLAISGDGRLAIILTGKTYTLVNLPDLSIHGTVPVTHPTAATHFAALDYDGKLLVAATVEHKQLAYAPSVTEYVNAIDLYEISTGERIDPGARRIATPKAAAAVRAGVAPALAGPIAVPAGYETFGFGVRTRLCGLWGALGDKPLRSVRVTRSSGQLMGRRKWTVHFIDPSTGSRSKVRVPVDMLGEGDLLGVTPDGAFAIASYESGEVGLADLRSDGALRPILAVSGCAHDCAFAETVPWMAIGHDEGATIWDLEAECPMRHIEYEKIHALALSPDGMRILLSGYDQEMGAVHDVPTGDHLFDLPVGQLAFASFAPDNAFMIIEGDRCWTPALVDVHAGAIVHDLEGYTGCAFSPAGGLVVARAGTAIALWDVATKREVDRLDFGRAADQAASPTWTPDGKAFVVSTERGLILGFEITG